MQTGEKNPKLHLALGFDENFIVPIYALFTSIFYNNRKNYIVFHVIATGLTIQQQDELRSYCEVNNSEIIFYQIDEDYVKSLVYIPDETHFTIATYYRLFFHMMLPPEVEKLLYIDSDTIVLGDLATLFNIDIGTAPIGAVPDSYPQIRYDLGMSKREDYFNAGVLLINIPTWKLHKVTENAIDFIAKFPEKIKYVDQDALNATLINKWYRLDKKYNLTWFDVSLQVPKNELVKDKVIIHYTTAQKPWNCLTRNKLRSYYHKYLKLSPKKHEAKYVDFSWTPEVLRVFLRLRIKELYFDYKIDKALPIKGWINAKLDY